MAANNLRILYNNVADNATITSTSTAAGYPTSNLKSDIKGLVWRTNSIASSTITLTWDSAQTIGAIILPFTNLSTSATIRVVCKNSAGTSIYDSNTIVAVPYALSTYNGNNYSYGGGSTVRVYLPNILITVFSIEITLVDGILNTSGYVEVSRIVCGTYWSPIYNTEFGLSVDYKDQSQHIRAQAGNIVTDISSVYKVLSFTLGYMNNTDRNNLINLLRANGMRKPLWVSLFPSDSDLEKEYIFSIYGKLSQNAIITHPMFSMYAATISIEEI